MSWYFELLMSNCLGEVREVMAGKVTAITLCKICGACFLHSVICFWFVVNDYYPFSFLSFAIYNHVFERVKLMQCR